MIKKPIPVALAIFVNSINICYVGCYFKIEITFVVRLGAFLDKVGRVLDKLLEGLNNESIHVRHYILDATASRLNVVNCNSFFGRVYSLRRILNRHL